MSKRKIGSPAPRSAPRLIGWVLVVAAIPFVLIADFYPLMRMGMFAEPVRTDEQIELYRLRQARPDGSSGWISTDESALADHHFDYLARAHVAQENTQALLLGAAEALALDRLGRLELWRIRIPRGAQAAADTALVDTLSFASP